MTNLLTPDEANKKWCVFARMLCIANDCMAWRWASELSVDNPSRIPGEGQAVTETCGYCGLAVRP